MNVAETISEICDAVYSHPVGTAACVVAGAFVIAGVSVLIRERKEDNARYNEIKKGLGGVKPAELPKHSWD